MDAFLREHFGMNNGVADIDDGHPGRVINLLNITISNGGGVYQLERGRKFENDLYTLTKVGTGKDGLPHISLT